MEKWFWLVAVAEPKVNQESETHMPWELVTW